MKKFFLTLVLAILATVTMNAGTLSDFFNNNVRPAAMMVQDANAELAQQQGLKVFSFAMLTEEAIANLLKEANFAEPVKVAADINEPSSTCKLFMLPNGEDSEVLMLAKTDEGCVALLGVGAEEKVQEMVKQ